MSGWQSQELGTAYQALAIARKRVAQPDDSPVVDAINRALEAIEEADELLERIA